MRTRFLNLRLAAGENSTEPAELVVDNGRIVDVLPAGTETAAGDERWVNLDGALVLPGVVDCHARIHDPSPTPREEVASGTAAAAAGGVTCVAEMAPGSGPAIRSTAELESAVGAIAAASHVDFMVWAAFDSRTLADPGWTRALAGLAQAGVAGVRVDLHSEDPERPPVDVPQLRTVLEEAAACSLPVAIHAEDANVVRELARRRRDQSAVGPEAWADVRPASAEVAAVSAVIQVCRATRARVHLLHLAAGEALDLVSAARLEGLPITTETCPHLLEFERADLARLGSILKTVPPVRTKADAERLWQGLANREIDVVASDHDPARWPEEKTGDSLWTDRAGIPGVELLLPYLYSAGYCSGRLTLRRLIELTATAPARLLGIDHRKGRIERGFDADFVVFDESSTWRVRGDLLHGLGRYTPFEGRTLTGRIRTTYLRGRPVFQTAADGEELFGPAGAGRYLARGMG